MKIREELRAIIYWLNDSLAAAQDELDQLEEVSTVTLTSELLHSAATSNCGFTHAQMKVMGFEKPVKGWLQSMVGKTIPISQWESFVAARNTKSASARWGIE